MVKANAYVKSKDFLCVNLQANVNFFFYFQKNEMLFKRSKIFEKFNSAVEIRINLDGKKIFFYK